MEEQGTVSSDRSTFKYYFGAMRPLSLAVGGAYIVGQAFSSTFRCECFFIDQLFDSALTNFCSCLAYVVG